MPSRVTVTPGAGWKLTFDPDRVKVPTFAGAPAGKTTAAFPLAIPLMAGPGALTAMILLAGRAHGDPLLLITLAVICGLVVLSCLAVFLTATPIAKLLGVTGNIVLTRLLGVILAALAVQFVIDGIKAAAQAGYGGSCSVSGPIAG